MRLFLFTVLLCLECTSFAAKPKKIKYQPLSNDELVKMGWRPTPTTAEIKKDGRFAGGTTVASIPTTLKK